MLPHSDNGMIATRLLMVGFDDGKQKKKIDLRSSYAR